MRVIVVDENRNQRESICRGLRLFGHQSVAVRSLDEAGRVLAAAATEVDVALVALGAGQAAAAFIRTAAERWPEVAVLAYDGEGEVEPAQLSPHPHLALLPAPFDPEILDQALRALSANHNKETQP
jgi:DNA-binding NtrC family response regulator